MSDEVKTIEEKIDEVFFRDPDGNSMLDQADAEIHVHMALLSMLYESGAINEKLFQTAMSRVSSKGGISHE